MPHGEFLESDRRHKPLTVSRAKTRITFAADHAASGCGDAALV
jgi:hypothetical protein